VLTDDCADTVDRAMRRASELAAQSSRGPSGVRLLAAVLEERTTSGFRAVSACGYWALPATAMQLATAPGRARASASVAESDGRLIPASVLARLDD
jgi:hypothetical protein